MKKYKVEIPKGYEVANEYSKLDNKENKSIVIELKVIKKELPKTWAEYLRTTNKCYPSINHIRVPLEYNEAFEALGSLIELRDHYNDGWKPDWTDENQDKWCLRPLRKTIETINFNITPRVLSFKNKSLAKEFLSNFAQLIETAKPLL
jgi:hypothetical protein